MSESDEGKSVFYRQPAAVGWELGFPVDRAELASIFERRILAMRATDPAFPADGKLTFLLYDVATATEEGLQRAMAAELQNEDIRGGVFITLSADARHSLFDTGFYRRQLSQTYYGMGDCSWAYLTGIVLLYGDTIAEVSDAARRAGFVDPNKEPT